jgi:hypothetical protein
VDRPFTLRIVALQAFAAGFPASQGTVVKWLGIGLTVLVSLLMLGVVVVLRHRTQLLELVRICILHYIVQTVPSRTYNNSVLFFYVALCSVSAACKTIHRCVPQGAQWHRRVCLPRAAQPPSRAGDVVCRTNFTEQVPTVPDQRSGHHRQCQWRTKTTAASSVLR